MKLDNKLILIFVAVIAIYAIFLFLSDFNIISEKISNFKINYLPLILLLFLILFTADCVCVLFVLLIADFIFGINEGNLYLFD